MNDPRTKRKNSFWMRKKLSTLIWLAVLAIVLLSVKAAIQNRIDRQLTQSLSQASGGKIERASVDFSLFQLPDLLKAAGALAEALQHPGRPVLEELILEQPEIDLIPLAPLRWELRIRLHGLSARAGTREVAMTRTDLRDAMFRLDPEGPVPLVFKPLNVLLEPSPDRPGQVIRYEIRGTGIEPDRRFEAAGELGPDASGKMGYTAQVEAERFPYAALLTSLPAGAGKLIDGGDLSISGQFEYRGQTLSVDGKAAGTGLQLHPEVVPGEAARKRLEAIAQSGEMKSRRVRLQLPLNRGEVDWNLVLAGVLGE
jgi:hypothetical protein